MPQLFLDRLPHAFKTPSIKVPRSGSSEFHQSSIDFGIGLVVEVACRGVPTFYPCPESNRNTRCNMRAERVWQPI
jgi:hypothetical protein